MPGTDALRLPAAPAGGALRLWFRTHVGFGTAVDRARLLVVEHGPEEEAHVAGSQVLVGTTRPVAAAWLTDGRSLDASFRLADGGALQVLPGDTLEVDLGADPGATLLVEGHATGGRGASEAMGFAALSRDGSGGWTVIGRATLRERTDRIAVPGLTGSRVRLAFTGNAEITGLQSLVQTSAPPRVTAVAPGLASNHYSGDLAAQVQSRDSLAAWLVDLDTLHLAFDVPAPAEGAHTSMFLALEGTPVSPGVAQANRGRRAQPESATGPLVFMLQQPRPNPSLRAATIEFTLPEPGVAKLEIFDAQGRRLRDYLARYEAGVHRIDWDLRSNRGRRVPPGVYTYRLRAGTKEMRRKAVVLP